MVTDGQALNGKNETLEIPDEIVGAGVRELYLFDEGDSKPDVVRGVFAAMLEASARSPVARSVLLGWLLGSAQQRG